MKKKKKNLKLSSAQIIPIAFLLVILLGAFLLYLPVSTAPGEKTSALTAMFTSTTSVCVTGSVVVDTFSHWSLFGKIVILLLIQTGGLGIIAVLGLLVILAKGEFSLSGSLLLRDAYNLDSARGITRFLVQVYIGTLLVEAVGAIGYMYAFIPRYGLIKGFWYSFFTSVSAFCNAGIDILGPDSLTSFHNRPLVLLTTMALIIMGGIGYVVWFDIIAEGRNKNIKITRPRARFRRLNEHTRLVLILTFAYILAGAVLVLFLEYQNPGTIGNMPFGQKVLNSFFESVTYRTAGFSTFPQENLREVTAILSVFFMFTGGSPVGTAGGVKTVTMFVLIVNVIAFIRAKNDAIIMKRRIPDALIKKATAIITVHFSISFILCICLMITSDISFIDAMFEIMSAVSTVGLSRAITPGLNNAGQIIVILAMYLGRISPISMFLFFHSGNYKEDPMHFADGKFIVG